MNVAKLLITPLFCISNCFVATLAVVGPLVIVMIPLTSICAHPFKLVGDFFPILGISRCKNQYELCFTPNILVSYVIFKIY